MPHKKLAGWEWLAITLILVSAFWLRVAHFTQVPPGVSHDEVFDWYNAQLIYRGELHALYPYGGGRETLYQLAVALTFRVIGSNIIGLRLPALALGMFGVAATYALTRRLFGRLAALVASLGLATSYWALTMSRLGERTGSAPVMGLIAVSLYARLLGRRTVPLWQFIAAGVMLGVSLYTYPAALMLPAVLIGWLVAVALLRREWLAGKWGKLALSLIAAALVALPLALAWMNPADTARANAVKGPLQALLAGDPGPVLANVGPVLGMFTVAGDSGVDVNNNSLPVYTTPVMQALFYLGLIWAGAGLLRRSDPRRLGYALALLWLAGMLVPTLVTQRALNPSRTVGLLGIAFVIPAIAVMGLRDVVQKAGQARLAFGGAACLALVGLTMQAQNTTYNYFVSWPQNDVMRFWYQDYYVSIAHDLDQRSDHPPTAVGGLTPYLMDPGSLILLMNDDAYAQALVFFDPRTSLLLPPPNGDHPMYVVVPHTVPLHPVLADLHPVYGIIHVERDYPDYTLYAVDALPTQPPLYEVRYRFGDLVDMTGLLSPASIQPGQIFTLVTIWRPITSSNTQLRIFVHVVDAAGNLVAQSDVLGVPATDWRAGEIIFQAHDLTLPLDPPPGPYTLQIGVYDPDTGARLIVLGGGDHIELGLNNP